MAAKQCYQSKQLLYRSKWNSKNFITIENGGSIRRKHRPEKDPEQMSLRTFPFEKNIDRGMDKDMVHIYSGGEGNSNTHQYSCLENPHGQRSLVGCSPWGCKESDMTERVSTEAH